MTVPSPFQNERRVKERERLRRVQEKYVDDEIELLCKAFADDLRRKALVISTMDWETDSLGITVHDIRRAAAQLLGMTEGKRQYGFSPGIEEYLGELTEPTLHPE